MLYQCKMCFLWTHSDNLCFRYCWSDAPHEERTRPVKRSRTWRLIILYFLLFFLLPFLLLIGLLLSISGYKTPESVIIAIIQEKKLLSYKQKLGKQIYTGELINLPSTVYKGTNCTSEFESWVQWITASLKWQYLLTVISSGDWPSPSSSSSSSFSSASFGSLSLSEGFSEQWEFESESESDSLSDALASSSLSPLCFLFLFLLSWREEKQDCIENKLASIKLAQWMVH